MARQRNRVLGIPVPPEAAHRALYDSLVELAGKEENVVVEGPKVWATVKVGWKSWGETVAGQVHGEPAGTRLEITSQAVLPTQLVDMGKHNQNLDKLVEALNRRLGVQVQELSRK